MYVYLCCWWALLLMFVCWCLCRVWWCVSRWFVRVWCWCRESGVRTSCRWWCQWCNGRVRLVSVYRWRCPRRRRQQFSECESLSEARECRILLALLMRWQAVVCRVIYIYIWCGRVSHRVFFLFLLHICTPLVCKSAAVRGRWPGTRARRRADGQGPPPAERGGAASRRGGSPGAGARQKCY